MAKESAQVSASQVASVLAMHDLSAVIQVSGGLAASDEAQSYVNDCMKNAGWRQLDD